MQEIWRDIDGYCGIYQISNFGRVKSCSRIIKRITGNYSVKEKIIKLKPDKKGYFKIRLFNDDGFKNYWLHRLVAKTFPEICGIWFEGCEVDHIDTNPSNNNAVNLKTCTSSENRRNQLTQEHQSISNGIAVSQYTKDGLLIKTYCSANKAHKETSIATSNICRTCKSERHTAGGYVWKYNYNYKKKE